MNETESGGREPFKSIFFYYFIVVTLIPGIAGFISDYFYMQYLPENELAALGLTGSFDSVTTIITALFPIGAQSVIAKSYGKKDYKAVVRDYTSAMLGLLTLLGVFVVLAVMFRYQIASLLGADDGVDLSEPCALIISWFSLGMIPDCIIYLVSVLLSMETGSKRIILFSMLLNSVLRVAGYAAVTAYSPKLYSYLAVGVLSETISMIVMLVFKHRKTKIFVFEPKQFSLRSFLHITNVGAPGGMEYLYVAIYEFVVYRYTISRFSEVYLPVFEIEDDISAITESLIVAMCLLLVHRLGMIYGSGDKERLRRELKRTWIVCISAAAVIAVIFAFVYPLLVDEFVGENGDNTALIRESASIDLICVCIGLPFYAANNIFTSIYEVRELVKHAHLNYILETCAFFILYSVLLGELIGSNGLWYAYPAAEASTLAVNFLLMTVHNRRLPKEWLDFMFPEAEKVWENGSMKGEC